MLMEIKGHKQNGFTLIEIMIVTAIVGVLAAVAVPSYRKYLFDAEEAEGVIVALGGWRDADRVRQYTGGFPELLDGAPGNIGNIIFRMPGNTKFNFAAGPINGSDLSPGGKTSFDQLTLGDTPPTPIYNFDFERQNEFGRGLFRNVDPNRTLIGVEADLLSDGAGRIHVLAVDEAGTLYRVCNEFVETQEPEIYQRYFGRSPTCSAGGGGSSGGGSSD